MILGGIYLGLFILFVLCLKIKAQSLRIISITLVVILAAVALWRGASWSQLAEKAKHEVELTRFDSIFFQGQVVSSYTKNGSTLLCVGLDSSTTDYYYHFNRYNALWIQDGFAILPIGLASEYDSLYQFKHKASYVIVNKDQSKTITYLRDGDTLTVPMTFWPGKLEQIHMTVFDHLRESNVIEYPTAIKEKNEIAKKKFRMLHQYTVVSWMFPG